MALNFNASTVFNLNKHKRNHPDVFKAARSFRWLRVKSNLAAVLASMPRLAAGTLVKLKRRRKLNTQGKLARQAVCFFAGAFILLMVGLAALFGAVMTPGTKYETLAIASAVSIASSAHCIMKVPGKVSRAVWVNRVRRAKTRPELLKLVLGAPGDIQETVRDLLTGMHAGDTKHVCDVLGVSKEDIEWLGASVLDTVPEKRPNRLAIVIPGAIRAVRSVIARAAKSKSTIGLAKKAVLYLALSGHILGAGTSAIRQGRSSVAMSRGNLLALRNMRTAGKVSRVPFPEAMNFNLAISKIFSRAGRNTRANPAPLLARNSTHNSGVLANARAGKVLQRTVADGADAVAEYALIAPGLDLCRSALVVVDGENMAWKRAWFGFHPTFAYLINSTRAMDSGLVHHIANRNSFSPSSDPFSPKCGVKRRYNLRGTQAQQYAVALKQARIQYIEDINEELSEVDTEIKVDITNDILEGMMVKIDIERTVPEIRDVWLQMGGIVGAAQTIADAEGIQNKLRHVYANDPSGSGFVPLRTFAQFLGLHSRKPRVS